MPKAYLNATSGREPGGDSIYTRPKKTSFLYVVFFVRGSSSRPRLGAWLGRGCWTSVAVTSNDQIDLSLTIIPLVPTMLASEWLFGGLGERW